MANTFPSAVRQAGNSDPGGDILFIVERDPRPESSCNLQDAFGEGLDGRVDGVADRDAGGCLSECGGRARLPERLAHVADEGHYELLATELQG